MTDPDLKKMCADKVAYTTFHAAQFFASADGLRPYHCPHCEMWHLTSLRVKHKRPVR